jgi:hypothetical protein
VNKNRNVLELDNPIADGRGVAHERLMPRNEIADYIAKLIGAEPLERWIVMCNSFRDAEQQAFLLNGFRDRRVGILHKMMSLTERKTVFEAFTNNNMYTLVCDVRMSVGWNASFCARMIFVEPQPRYAREQDQAIMRCLRFGQKHLVHVYVLTAWEPVEGKEVEANQ